MGGGALVDIGFEFAFWGFAFHGGDDFIADDEAAEVFAFAFFDKFLDEDIGFEAGEGADDAFRRFIGFSEDDADAFGAFEEFYDEGGAADHFDEFFGVAGGVSESCDGHIDAFF